MMLGETEFRHQVESTIRPFRDVLLGLFFVSIGMLFDPPRCRRSGTGRCGAPALLLEQGRAGGADRPLTGHRRADRLEDGLAAGGRRRVRLRPAGDRAGAGVIDNEPAQIALTAVLLSMIAGPFLIRYNHALARFCVAAPQRRASRARPRRRFPPRPLCVTT
jgi:monovalent cation:H+ antiporter-2, CPA2 family